jgi:hypothetical protein
MPEEAILSKLFTDPDAMQEAGFRGFHTISSLRETKLRRVPKKQGVYLVLRLSHSPPVFLKQSVGGHYRGDPTLPRRVLIARWVMGSPILYVGKAGATGKKATLRSRLGLYLRFGAGKTCSHWGGRYVWQLKDSESLVVCWKRTPREEPRAVEKQLNQLFRKEFGVRPFANCTT